MTEFTVKVHEDGSVIVLWPLPGKGFGNDAAILGRESVAASVLTTTLTAVRGGARG